VLLSPRCFYHVQHTAWQKSQLLPNDKRNQTNLTFLCSSNFWKTLWGRNIQILYPLCELTLYRCYLFCETFKLVTFLCSRKLAFISSSTLEFKRDILTYLKLYIFFWNSNCGPFEFILEIRFTLNTYDEMNYILFTNLVGCLYYFISDARSHKHQIHNSLYLQVLHDVETFLLSSCSPGCQYWHQELWRNILREVTYWM